MLNADASDAVAVVPVALGTVGVEAVGIEGVVTTNEGVIVCGLGVRSKNSGGDSPITTGSPDTPSDSETEIGGDDGDDDPVDALLKC